MDEGPMMSLSHSQSITEYVYVQENWMKVIKYVIKFTDSSGESNNLRSAKDFKVLRKILILRWPGCIIPTLPDAYSKKNPSLHLIPQCLHIHSSFLNKISSVEYFFNSDVVQLFIKGPAEFIKLTKAYKIPTYTSIAENFESNFKESLDYHLNEGSMASLEEKKKKYGETILFLNELEKTAIGNAKCLKDYKNATAGTLKSIESTYKWLNPEQGENELAFGENCPYSRLSNWVLEQSQDLNAVIEAIHKIEELIKVKEITGGSINAANLEIQKLAVGKKSLAAILNNKSKDDMIKAKQNLINELNSQIKAVDIIIPVVTSKLLNTEIPNIENKNLTSFDKEIKNFAEMSIKEFMDIKRKLVVTN